MMNNMCLYIAIALNMAAAVYFAVEAIKANKRYCRIMKKYRQASRENFKIGMEVCTLRQRIRELIKER